MNLKVNLDGRGFKDVAKENLDYMKAKRNEFYRLNMTTIGIVMASTFMLASMRGHLKQNVTTSVLLWNAAGLAMTAVLSLGAK